MSELTSKELEIAKYYAFIIQMEENAQSEQVQEMTLNS